MAIPPPIAPYLWTCASDTTTHQASCQECDYEESILGRLATSPEDHVIKTGHTVHIVYLHRRIFESVPTS